MDGLGKAGSYHCVASAPTQEEWGATLRKHKLLKGELAIVAGAHLESDGEGKMGEREQEEHGRSLPQSIV